ncbi:MAG TPA: ATP-binding protein [Candidatus Binataceae bacterium]|nr:ATP-binding protein [Candidatus Binataceae bacterium]
MLRELVDEVRPYFDAASHGKALQLKIDLSAAPHRIRSWRRALKSILLNLGLNAIKFTEAGSVVMAIRGLPSRSGLTLLEIRANDSGVGFDRAKFLAVRPWVQISNSSTRLYRGMGLGLSVVLNNVEKLGGSVCVSTAPDRGSRFRVRIPLAPVPPASDNAA